MVCILDGAARLSPPGSEGKRYSALTSHPRGNRQWEVTEMLTESRRCSLLIGKQIRKCNVDPPPAPLWIKLLPAHQIQCLLEVKAATQIRSSRHFIHL